MGLLDTARSFLGLKEKSENGLVGPINWTRSGGIPVSWPTDWFQRGWNPKQGRGGGSVVEACIGAYARTLAQLPGKHYIEEEDGSRRYMPTSRLSKVLHRPNNFQTASDQKLNTVYQLLGNGNAYLVRSENWEHIYLLNSAETTPIRAKETGDVFYATGGAFADFLLGEDDLGHDGRVMIPERYVCHIRLHTPLDPLVGVTPIENAAMSVASNLAITGQQAAFFSNMSRPSGVLSTEMDLTKDQIGMLRDAWNEQAKSLNNGGVPILGSGLKWDQIGSSNKDNEMIDALRFTVEDISRVLGVPMMLINSMENATFDNAETLMRFWLSAGLGFLVNHIEEALAMFYNLPAGQGVEFDTEVLLRSDLQARLEAMGIGVTKGIYAPNEARKKEGLSPVEGGDMPLVQQQMVPVNLAATGEAIGASGDEPPEDEPQPTPEDEDETIDERALILLVRSHAEELHNAT